MTEKVLNDRAAGSQRVAACLADLARRFVLHAKSEAPVVFAKILTHLDSKATGGPAPRPLVQLIEGAVQ
jgi:hypothetical protein